MTNRRREGGELPLIVVVGPCASGKTTLVENLVKAGFNARVCGQEHSDIRDFWRTLNPAFLVALDVDLATLRSRRSPHWSELLYQKQHLRLASAFVEADIVIDTGMHDAQWALESVISARHKKSL